MVSSMGISNIIFDLFSAFYHQTYKFEIVFEPEVEFSEIIFPCNGFLFNHVQPLVYILSLLILWKKNHGF